MLIRCCLLLCVTVSQLLAQVAGDGRDLLSVDRDFDLNRVASRGATPAMAERDGRMMLVMKVSPSNDGWPGMFIPAADKAWDLSAFNRVEFEVQNTGSVPVRVGCRLDDDPKADGQKHCNTENASLDPGMSKTVRVMFGRSYGGNPGWALNRANVIGALVFMDKPKADAQVTIHSIKALGGDLPGQVRISAGDEWQAINNDELLVEKGSALDFSFMLDAPAGKHGEVIIRDGHFYFRNKPEQRLRLYGTNVVYGANYPEKPVAEQAAEQLARIGYNSLRFHHFDQIILDKSAGDSVTFDAAALDKLDYFFAECKKRGLYLTIDLFATRETKPGEIPELSGKVSGQAYKGAVQLLPSARKNWEQFTANLLKHVNPYTGLAWKDDPALFLVCLLNEGNLYQTWNANAQLKSIAEAQFEEWLNEKATRPSSDDELKVAFNRFLTEKQREWFAHGTRFLRDLGYKSLITDANYISMRTHAIIRDELDVVDMHCYWAAGNFMGEWGTSPMKYNPQDQVKAGADMPLKGLVARLFGKPLVMTEFNTQFPNAYRASSGPVFGGYSALNDVDAIYRFDYVGTPITKPTRIMWLSTAHDPIQLLSERLGVLLFTRSDLKPAEVQVPYLVSEKYLENPKALDWSHWYPDPYSFTGIHSQIGTIVLRDGETLKTPFKFAVTTESIDESRLAGVRLVDPGTGANRAKLREMRLIAPAAGQGDQLRLDRKTGDMIVATDRSECLVLGDKTPALAGKLVKVDNADVHATIGVAAIDDQPLATSRRILILHLTDVTNSDILFRDKTMSVVEKFGDLPLLARKGSARIHLAGTGWESARLWSLDLMGKRMGEVPLERSAVGVSFTVTTRRAEGACLAYELVR